MNVSLTLPCSDGSDPDCSGRVPAETVSASYEQLTNRQKQEFRTRAKRYTAHISDEFEEVIAGTIVSATPGTCFACGSDS